MARKVSASFSRRLLSWYDRHARDLPWRVMPGTGEVPDPYRVWLSEIMLQQTVVKAVMPYFETFTRSWPTVEALAASPQEDVLTAWAGLGYYSRARNLHACAVKVAEDFDGIFPQDEKALLSLPGIGAYTAAAIRAIAFDQPANVVDGNVERVMARWRGLETPLPDGKKDMAVAAAGLVPDQRPGDYAQALMDLGATVCTPRSPNCLICPVSEDCVARKKGIAAELPKRAPKKKKPTRTGTVWWLEDGRGHVLLRRRPAKGLLGGMMEIPSTGWAQDADATLPNIKDWRPLPGTVRHTFTHFHLELTVMTAKVKRRPQRIEDGAWVKVSGLENAGLPSVMMKAVKLVRPASQTAASDA